MRRIGLLFGLVVITGFFGEKRAKGADELEKYCNETGISQKELEYEATSAGVTSEQLLGMIRAEKPLFDVETEDGNATTKESSKNESSILSPYGDDDVLGFVLSSSFSDVNESFAGNNTCSEGDPSKTATAIPALNSEAMGESDMTYGSGMNSYKAKNEGGNRGNNYLEKYITVPVKIPGANGKGVSMGVLGSNSVECSNRKLNDINLREKVGEMGKSIMDDGKHRKKSALRVIRVRGNSFTGEELNRRYFIVNNRGEKQEYKVVKYIPGGKHSREARPRRVKVVRRVIQPIIVTQPGLVPLQQGNGMFITPPISSTPNFVPGNANNVVFPSGSSPVQNQGQQRDIQGRTSDEREFLERRDNKSAGGSPLLGPMTVAVIVIILLIVCIVGGFCFCGARRVGGDSGYVPLQPPPPPPHNGPVSKQPPSGYPAGPPPRGPSSQYMRDQLGTKAPLVPQHPTPPHQSNQVFGYAIVPSI